MTAVHDHPVGGDGPTAVGGAAQDVFGAGTTEELTVRYRRSPRDLLRLIVYAVSTILLIALTVGVEDSILGFEQDLVRVFDFLSPTVERVLHGALEWLGLVFVGGDPPGPAHHEALPPVRLHHHCQRRCLRPDVGGRWRSSTATNRTLLVNEIAARAGVTDVDVERRARVRPVRCGVHRCSAPFVSAPWRAGGVVLIGAARLAALPGLLPPAGQRDRGPPARRDGRLRRAARFGRPDRRPTTSAIRLALIDAGLPVAEVHAAKVDARGSTPYFAHARRRRRAVRQGARRGGAGGRPDVPPLPLPATEGRRRRPSVLVAAPHGRARGAGVARRP